jgi:hypothetical protein
LRHSNEPIPKSLSKIPIKVELKVLHVDFENLEGGGEAMKQKGRCMGETLKESTKSHLDPQLQEYVYMSNILT